MTIPVEEKPTPRASTIPSVNGVNTGRAVVDGGAAAASKHVIAASGATNALQEMIRVDMPANTYSVDVLNITGQGKEPVEVRVIVDPIDDVDAANYLTSGYSPARVVPPNDTMTINTIGIAPAAFSLYWVACPIAGSTLANTGAAVIVEGN